MYSLLIHLVAFSQIIVLYGMTAPTNFRLLHQTFLDKNRQWVNDNDAFAQKYTSPKYSIVLSYMIGMGWLVYLGYSALAHASESTLFAFLFWSLLAWGVFCGMFG
jgi:hypothetical protein